MSNGKCELRIRGLLCPMVRDDSMLVAIDEAGSTPGNLLDESQPFMVLSGVVASDEVARDIIKTFYPNRAEELHHTRMYGCIAHNDNLIRIHERCLSELNAISYVIPKRMACCEAFVLDCVVKAPLFNGFIGSPDYYNLIWHMNDVYADDQKVAELLKAYVAAIAGRRNGLTVLMEKIREQTDQMLTSYLDDSILAELSIEDALREKNPHGLIDGMFMELLQWYGERLEGPFDVAYDNSPQLDLLIGPLIEQIRKAHDERWCSRVGNVYPLDSKKSYALQLADVVAGGVLQMKMAERRNGECNDIQKKLYVDSMCNLYNKFPGRILYKYEDALRCVGNPEMLKVSEFWLR